MTKIAQNTVAKLSVAFVAAAMTLSLYAPAQAQTVEELQAQIAALMAQINSLQSSTGSTGSMTGSCTTPAAPLTMGSQGADVTALQNLLISMGQSIPAGATGYFGAQTQSALAAWQAANGVSPAAGYYGPITKAAMDAKCVPATDDSDDEGEDDDSETGSDELQGEGVLETYEIDDSEDQVQEGAEDEVVMEITAEAQDGDVELNRLTMTLVADAGNDELDPWDVYEEVSVWVDGEKIADFDASDEDNYLDEDAGEFRFSDLGLVLPEDEEVEILVAVTVAGSVDGTATAQPWTIDVTEGRTFDADGVADTDAFDEMNGGGITFDIVEEGIDDDASIESNSSSPDAATLLVEDNTSESDEYTVHIFDIEVDEDSSDLVLDDAFVDVTIVNTAAGADIAGQDEVIADITLTIDGQTETGEAVTGAADTEATVIQDSTTDAGGTTVRYRFEFDGLDLEADTTYEAEVAMVFEGTDGDAAYEAGVTVDTSVTGSLWEVEGLADDNVLTGTDSSETHTLNTVVPVISDTSFSTDRNEAGDSGVISFEFTVAAEDDDYVFDSSTDIVYTIVGPNGNTASTSGTVSVIAGDYTGTDPWTIQEGDDATFVLDVTITANDSADNGAYRVYVDTVGGIEVDETSTSMTLTDV